MSNTEHIEDEILNFGVDGARSAINFMQAVRDMLAGNSKSSIRMTVKWDGCVHEDTIIATNHGDLTIKEIYDSPDLWSSMMVYGHDFDTNKSIMTPLVAAMKDDGSKDWVEVVTEYGAIKLTEDHEVYTINRGWVAAGSLQEGDDIAEENFTVK